MTTRDEAITRARTGSLIDRAFWFLDFNGGFDAMRNGPKLAVSEVFEDQPRPALDEALSKAGALKRDEGYFGEKYWCQTPHPAIIEEMRRMHPGFADAVYATVLHRGIIATR